jgi:hypothetical protein
VPEIAVARIGITTEDRWQRELSVDSWCKGELIGDPRRREKIHALIAIAQDMIAEAKSLRERDLTFVIELLSKHLHLKTKYCVAFQPPPIEGGGPRALYTLCFAKPNLKRRRLEVVFVVRARYFTRSRM